MREGGRFWEGNFGVGDVGFRFLMHFLGFLLSFGERYPSSESEKRGGKGGRGDQGEVGFGRDGVGEEGWCGGRGMHITPS